MRHHTNSIHLGNHVLELANLPEAAQEELATFYEFLVFKYQEQTETEQVDKQEILSQIFKEAEGILPEQYRFDREELHER